MGCKDCGYETGNHSGSICSVDDREEIQHLRARIAALESQLADRDAEIERLRARLDEAEIERVRSGLAWSEENAELRADLVWSVRNGVMVSHDENLRPCVWFDVHRGVECDGTDAGILAALRRAKEGEK